MTKIQVRLNPDVPPTGSDLSIVNAARRSFNTRSEWDYFSKTDRNVQMDPSLYSKKELESRATKVLNPKDKRLLEFLARGMTAVDFQSFLGEFDDRQMGGAGDYNEVVKHLWAWRNTPTHDTPFNHTFISFEVKAPIFVRAQLVKHEYLIMSEFSRRYITDNIEFYEPEMWRKAATNKKQGSTNEPVDFTTVMSCSGLLPHEYLYDAAIEHYNELLRCGVAPEQARMVLPQSTMTEWTWSGTLGAFAKMCTLRLHPEAQYEARLVAQEVYKCLKDQWPVGAKALVEGV